MATSLPGRRIKGVTDQPDFDLGTWPEPDVGALSEDSRRDYLVRKTAVEMCVAGASGETIKRASGIGLKQAVRLIRERCCVTHPDGRIYGFRGLVKRLRINPVQRNKPVRLDQFGRGGAGAMNSLLDLAPGLRAKLDAKILRTYQGDGLSEVKRPRTAVWRWFLDELRGRGYETRQEWPFNSGSLGYGALRRYVDQVLTSHPRAAAREAGGQNLQRKLLAADGVDRPVERPFQRVEMDAHKLDGRFCVLMPDNVGGWVPRIIHRLWVIVILEVMSRAVLGYYLSMAREVSKLDVLRAIKRALSPWIPRAAAYADQPLVEGAGLPPVLGDAFVGLCWEETSVDGALAQTCQTVKTQLADVVGSRLVEPANSFAARRSLDDRPFIETFFRTLGDRGLQRLSNTTGPRPQGKRVASPDDVAVASQFQYEYLEELLQSLICNANATPHSALGYRTPLQMLAYYQERGMLPVRRADPGLVQGLLSYRKLCTVRGGAAQGRAPYLNFAGARYGGPAIKDRDDLVGKQVWVTNHLEDDARVVRCTTVNGEAVGTIRAAPPWHRLPHSLAVRRAIQSLESQKRIATLGNDAIQTFMTFVEKQPGRKLPVHPAYLEVRRILAEQAKTFEGEGAAKRALLTLAEHHRHDADSAVPMPAAVAESASPAPTAGEPPATVSPGPATRRQLPARRLAAD